MNVSFAWPTKHPLPQFRTTRVAIAGLGVLLASCSDGLTSPKEQAPRSSSPAAVTPRGFVAPDVVVMERTTTDAARDGEAPVTRSSREVLTPQTRLAGTTMGTRALPATPTTAPRELPRPPLFLPARREVGICSALPSWTDVTKGPNGRDIVIGGIGDAPASTMKIPQADGSIWTVERSWTRTATSWQLDRQVTKGANGYRDVVTYHHQDAAGKSVNNALPVATCTGQQQLAGQPSVTASRTFYPAYNGALYAKLVPGSGVSADDGCLDSSSDPCFEKRLAVYRSDVKVIAAAAGVTLACVTPVNVTVAPCAGAIVIYLAAVANLAIDQAALQHCIEEAGKPNLPELSVTAGARSALGASSTHVARSVAGIGATSLNSCGGYGSGGTTAGMHCEWQTWEITYDGGDTWYFFGTFMFCDNAM